MTLRTLIVDDEPAARRGVRRLLSAEADVEVVGECGDGIDAVDKIRALTPDLVFLDIQMPGRNGLEVVREIGIDHMPVVIFLTAYDQYAVDAFEVHALDYLVKPVEPERFAAAVQRARGAIRRDDGVSREALRSVLVELGYAKAPAWATRLAVRGVGKIALVDVDRISVLEAAGNTVMVKTDKAAKPHTLRDSLTAVEARLDPARFVRISRSAIVNLQRIVEIQTLFDGDFAVVLDDGTTVLGSRRYREKLGAYLG
jgi:two-component system LytT family response regulator